MKRIFLANRKDEPDIAARIAEAARAIERVSNGKPYQITAARDFFEDNFKRCGSWEAFAIEVAKGIDPISREPLFHAIMVPAAPIGAGTVRIIEYALFIGKLVMAFDREGRMARVVRTIARDRSDWQSGYSLQVERALS